MATRTMFAGDTYPPLRGEASDETGILDLTSAIGLEVLCDGTGAAAGTQITGTAVAIAPPYLADADNIHKWNWSYQWVAGDTAVVGDYNVYLKVTWNVGQVETFGPDTLSIKAAP